MTSCRCAKQDILIDNAEAQRYLNIKLKMSYTKGEEPYTETLPIQNIPLSS